MLRPPTRLHSHAVELLKQVATDHLVLRQTELYNKLLTIIGIDIVVIWPIPARQMFGHLVGTSRWDISLVHQSEAQRERSNTLLEYESKRRRTTK